MATKVSPRLAKKIERSGLLRVVRRVLFTAVDPSATAGPFDLSHFYQFGSGVVLVSQGTVYVLTPSHVVRNATRNRYDNDSPLWVPIRHEQPTDIQDFLMPMRYFDCSPDGEERLDVGLVEMNPMIFGLGDCLNWDEGAVFVTDPVAAHGTTAVVAGYPEEVNPYEFLETEAGIQQVARVKQERFRGVITVDDDGMWLENPNHSPGYEYAGLSGGVVVCAIDESPMYLGIAISHAGGGKRFKVQSFAEIRASLGDFARLGWEVLDEAFFLASMTHERMNYSAFSRFFEMKIREDFLPKRTNVYLEQLERSRDHGGRDHWIIDLNQAQLELSMRLRDELVSTIKQVARGRQSRD
ncbi:hypothetical protein [Cupriavidus sp. 8B]